MENPNHKWRVLMGKSSISMAHLFHGYDNSRNHRLSASPGVWKCGKRSASSSPLRSTNRRGFSKRICELFYDIIPSISIYEPSWNYILYICIHTYICTYIYGTWSIKASFQCPVDTQEYSPTHPGNHRNSKLITGRKGLFHSTSNIKIYQAKISETQLIHWGYFNMKKSEKKLLERLLPDMSWRGSLQGPPRVPGSPLFHRACKQPQSGQNHFGRHGGFF